jgi:hypothetical protein
MSLNLSDCPVLSAGVVDLEATLRNVAEVCAAYNAELAADLEMVAPAVHAVFDKYPGASINMLALKNLALTELGVSFDQYAVMSERVHTFVKANEGTLFEIKRGKGGGCLRIADKPAV